MSQQIVQDVCGKHFVTDGSGEKQILDKAADDKEACCWSIFGKTIIITRTIIKAKITIIIVKRKIQQ